MTDNLSAYNIHFINKQGINMIYFMYAIASIIIFNLLVMAFIVWKFGIDVFFDKDEEATKDIPLERTQ